MELRIVRQANGTDDISLIFMVIFDPEEHQALTAYAAWESSCLDRIVASRGFWRDSYTIRRPAWRDFVEPGIRIQGFTDMYAETTEKEFRENIGPRLRKAIAPILEQYRKRIHQEASQRRDAYYGAGLTSPRLLR